MRIKTPIVPVLDSKANDTGASAVTPGNVDNVNNFVQNEIVGEPEDPLRQARDFSGHRIIEAEKFKTTVSAPPTGNVMLPLNQSFGEGHDNFIAPSLAPAAWQPDADDSFFHITCHIDPNLREKIEKGEFIELDKLLPKDKFSKNYEDQKVELVNREGSTFFVAAGRYDKISGIKKWEQAFRIYAAIYSKANPHRSAEIWQYVEVIHLAASAYAWENVASYDNIFRHLMSQYPDRSWAKTYTQMWHLSMRDPLPQRFRSVNNSGGGGSGRKQRDNYCWKFQKNDMGSCRFEHRCKYCDRTSHGLSTCRKRKGDRRELGDDNRKNDN